MRDTSNKRPDAITVERLAGGRARVYLCTNITELTADQTEPVYEYDRYTIETGYSDNLIERATAGFDAWIEQITSAEAAKKAAEVRAERDRLLAESDADMTIDRALQIEIPDRITATTVLVVVKELFEALGSALGGSMASYRQALRDIPQQPGFPYTITWPTRPSND